MEKKEFKAFLKELRMKNGIRYKKTYSQAENDAYEALYQEDKLPKGVYKDFEENTFYSYSTDFDMSADEMQELLMHYQLESINTIKKCVLFYTILTISSLVLGLLIMLFGL